jgi:hypothetical protein
MSEIVNTTDSRFKLIADPSVPIGCRQVGGNIVIDGVAEAIAAGGRIVLEHFAALEAQKCAAPNDPNHDAYINSLFELIKH